MKCDQTKNNAQLGANHSTKTCLKQHIYYMIHIYANCLSPKKNICSFEGFLLDTLNNGDFLRKKRLPAFVIHQELIDASCGECVHKHHHQVGGWGALNDNLHVRRSPLDFRCIKGQGCTNNTSFSPCQFEAIHIIHNPNQAIFGDQARL